MYFCHVYCFGPLILNQCVPVCLSISIIGEIVINIYLIYAIICENMKSINIILVCFLLSNYGLITLLVIYVIV